MPSDTAGVVKITVELPAASLDRAREVAAREDTTLKPLVEEGLRVAVARRAQPGTFVLRDARFGTGGRAGEPVAARVVGCADQPRETEEWRTHRINCGRLWPRAARH